jgi:methionyl-tRNA synthetase
MIDKYFDGTMPSNRQSGDFDNELMEVVINTPKKVEELMDNLQFNVALSEIWKTVSRTNKYIDETMPWILAKDEEKRERLAAVMYNLAESIRIISVLIQPFMPETPEKIWNQLGLADSDATSWESAKKWGSYPGGAKVNKGESLFPRIDLEKEMKELEEIEKKTKEEKQRKLSENTDKSNKKEQITIDDFAKIDLRVGKVIEAEKVEKADKLLKLKLEVGEETRQVVAGIAKHYKPEDIIGKYVIIVANLKPVKLRGIESQGMILAASNDKDLVVATVDNMIESGARVK